MLTLIVLLVCRDVPCDENIGQKSCIMSNMGSALALIAKTAKSQLAKLSSGKDRK